MQTLKTEKSSCGTYKIKYHNGGYLLSLGKGKLQSFRVLQL